MKFDMKVRDLAKASASVIATVIDADVESKIEKIDSQIESLLQKRADLEKGLLLRD